MTRYPIAMRAMMLVYFNESKRRKNESGITTSLAGSAVLSDGADKNLT